MTAATSMVGVCLTTVGLVKIGERHYGLSRVDQFLALDALFFLVSACLAYLAMRQVQRARLQQRYERWAETMFLCGMAGMMTILVMFAFDGL